MSSTARTATRHRTRTRARWRDWPIGDTPNGSTALIRYADNCDAAGNCFLAVNANDGMLHLYDTSNGEEIFAIIPGHAWGEDLFVTEHRMRDIMDQPNFDRMRRFMFDGEMRVYHDDRNGNGNIDGTETAYLIAGLGRGGKQYIRFNASSGGAFQSALSSDNWAGLPGPEPIMFDDMSSYRHFRNAWNVGWLGKFRDTRTQAVMDTMIFPSGHDPAEDINTTNFGALQGQVSIPPTGTVINDMPGSVGIVPEWASFQGAVNHICSLVPPPFGPLFPPACPTVTSCTPCASTAPGDCSERALGFGGVPTPLPCYDWQGWAAVPNSPITNLGAGSGFTLPFGPVQRAEHAGLPDRLQQPRAARSRTITFRSATTTATRSSATTGNGGVRWTRASIRPVTRRRPTSSPTTPWIYDSAFQFVIVTDGVDDHWPRPSGTSRLGQPHREHVAPVRSRATRYPSLYIVDLARWNVGCRRAVDTFSSSVRRTAAQADALVARITANCDTGNTTLGSTEVCYDLARSGHRTTAPTTCST